jgi:hypothetical protein
MKIVILSCFPNTELGDLGNAKLRIGDFRKEIYVSSYPLQKSRQTVPWRNFFKRFSRIPYSAVGNNTKTIIMEPLGALREEKQRLRDENKRLKGEQGKPTIRPNRKSGSCQFGTGTAESRDACA